MFGLVGVNGSPLYRVDRFLLLFVNPLVVSKTDTITPNPHLGVFAALDKRAESSMPLKSKLAASTAKIAYTLPPLAVSIVRFSSTKQADGDSYRRQLAGSQSFCAARNWELDLSLHERDVRKHTASAMRGDQIRKGVLGRFIALVKAGKLPKHRQIILLVEEIDRLTRQVHDQAYDLCLSLMRLGVWICTTMDGEIYTLDRINSSLETRLKLQLKLDAAREHSEKLSNRLSEVWENRRARILAGEKIVTDATPAFLTVKDGKVVLPPENKQTLIRINRLCREGLGVRRITKLFNTPPRVPTFTGAKSWSQTAIQKYLEMRSTFGEATFYRVDKESVPGTAIKIPVMTEKDYYPAAISETDFILAEQARQRRKGVGPIHKEGRFSNLFSGMGKCWCGATLRYSDKGRDRRYLFCGHSTHNRGCDNHRHYDYDGIEREVLALLLLFDVSRFTSQPDDGSDKIEALEAQIRDKDERANWLAESGEMTRRTREQMDKLDREIDELQERLDEIRKTVLIAEARGDAHREFADMVDQMWQADPEDENRKALRARISQDLRRIIESIRAEGEDLLVWLHRTRQWQIGFRLAASAPHPRGRHQKIQYKILSTLWQGVGERQEKPFTLEYLGARLGSMERWIDGTALAKFEQHSAEVMARVKAAVESMSDAELATLAQSPDRIAALGEAK
jgi:DNA invertase Pin-like site-specific DNA recombinase